MRPLAPHPVLASRLAAPWLALLALSLPASARADTPPPSARPPLDRAGVLDRQALITAVLAENPSVEAARQAVRAAKARPAQEHALDDPMLGYTIAPASIATDAVRFGQTITVSQKLPWPGKRRLAAAAARFEADVALADYDALRLSLSVLASTLFDRYFYVERALAVNQAQQALLTALVDTAHARYVAGSGSRDDTLQARLALIHERHKAVMLRAERRLVVAKVNELLHRAPDTALPDAPEHLSVPILVTSSTATLTEAARRARPELKGAAAQVRAMQERHENARRARFPDFTVRGTYDSMWAMKRHQWMVGVSLNLPLQIGANRARIEEAAAERARAAADALATADRVANEVKEARVRFREAHHIGQQIGHPLRPDFLEEVRRADRDRVDRARANPDLPPRRHGAQAPGRKIRVGRTEGPEDVDGFHGVTVTFARWLHKARFRLHLGAHEPRPDDPPVHRPVPDTGPEARRLERVGRAPAPAILSRQPRHRERRP